MIAAFDRIYVRVACKCMATDVVLLNENILFKYKVYTYQVFPDAI